jgi:hypothetical protein
MRKKNERLIHIKWMRFVDDGWAHSHDCAVPAEVMSAELFFLQVQL